MTNKTTATAEFVETQCFTGGSSCHAWSDWYWEMLERARALPDCPPPGAFTEADDYLEMSVEFAERLCAEGAEPKVRIASRKCASREHCDWWKRTTGALQHA